MWMEWRMSLISGLLVGCVLYFCSGRLHGYYHDETTTSNVGLAVGSDQRRQLFELKFLSDIVPQVSQQIAQNIASTISKEKPLEFLSQEQTDQHLRKQPDANAHGVTPVSAGPDNTKTTVKGNSKPLEFLSIPKDTDKPEPTGQSSVGDGMMHFLGNGESSTQQRPSPSTPQSTTGFGTTTSSSSSSVVSSTAAGSATKDEVELHKLSIVSDHPFVSPRTGSDIDPQHQISLLLCPNQSKCVVPELQLQKKMKIYFCNHPTNSGVRFYFLAREGLLLHPNVEMVPFEEIQNADYIMYLPGSAPWHLTECKNASFAKKLIVLDEFDGHTLVTPTITPDEYVQAYGGRAQPWYLIYFKRSFVTRRDGIFKRFPHLAQPEVYPMTYAVAEAYIPSHFNVKREIEILCTLRGHKAMSTRLRTQHWVAEYGRSRLIKNIISGEVNTGSRKTMSMQYFQQMFNAQIIVTVNPANWEGDFRLWESMCTGALVFVDPVFVPHQYPLQDGVHVVFFSNTNRTELFDKLDYYRNPANQAEARRIAVNGYLYAMKYHRTVNLIDYILRTVHTKHALDQGLAAPSYVYTGQYLNHEAHVQEEMIIKCHRPGNYLVPSATTSDSAVSVVSQTAAVAVRTPNRLTCSTDEQQRVKLAIRQFLHQREAEKVAEEAAEKAKEAEAAAVAAGKLLTTTDSTTTSSTGGSIFAQQSGDVDVTKLEPPTPAFARNINFSRR